MNISDFLIANRKNDIVAMKEFAATASVGTIIDNGCLVFRIICQHGLLEEAKRMSQFPQVKANIAADGVNGAGGGYSRKSALSLASKNGHEDVVDFLLTFPAIVDTITANECDAIVKAAEGGNVGILKKLLKLVPPADLAFYKKPILRGACQYGRAEVVGFLFTLPGFVDADVLTFDFYSPLRNAAKSGSIETVNVILAKNPHVMREYRSAARPFFVGEDYGYSALEFACVNGDLPMVNRLLAEFPNDDVTIRDNRAYKLAHKGGNPDVLRRLREFPKVAAAAPELDAFFEKAEAKRKAEEAELDVLVDAALAEEAANPKPKLRARC